MDKKQEKRLEYLLDRIMELEEIISSYKDLYSKALDTISDLKEKNNGTVSAE